MLKSPVIKKVLWHHKGPAFKGANSKNSSLLEGL